MKAQPEAGIEARDPQQRTEDTRVKGERLAAASPRFQARLAGVIAWITTTSGFAPIVSGSLVVPDDAAAPSHNILAHEPLFRLALSGAGLPRRDIAFRLLLYH